VDHAEIFAQVADHGPTLGGQPDVAHVVSLAPVLGLLLAVQEDHSQGTTLADVPEDQVIFSGGDQDVPGQEQHVPADAVVLVDGVHQVARVLVPDADLVVRPGADHVKQGGQQRGDPGTLVGFQAEDTGARHQVPDTDLAHLAAAQGRRWC